ncbi:hypothetical protein DFJ69_6410 [Thermomonospora umbrina]|uniref:Uncharacterized protein n=1 Tax=Thermomonospora umbrina TaxID=111806 RepID=A0A3D9SZ21_9ACTN|nr:hypothetical protein DFJ69_6410 [Thermomonospora umbrina]
MNTPSVNGTDCLGSNRPAPRTAISKPTTWWGSTYGSRVDVQAYGGCVATIGYPGRRDLTPTEADPDKMYTGNHGGTSSAGTYTHRNTLVPIGTTRQGRAHEMRTGRQARWGAGGPVRPVHGQALLKVFLAQR